MARALGKEWVFAEGLYYSPWQSFIGKNLAKFLCEGCRWRPSVKTFFFKIKRKFLCRGLWVEALGKDSIQGNSTVIVTFFCRGPDKWPSAKTLFADSKFPESFLPRAALGKAFAEGFAEGFWAFAEDFGPSAKRARPVVGPQSHPLSCQSNLSLSGTKNSIIYLHYFLLSSSFLSLLLYVEISGPMTRTMLLPHNGSNAMFMEALRSDKRTKHRFR